MISIQRWYDKNPSVGELFKVLKSMPAKEMEQFGFYLYQVADDCWKRRKIEEDSISLGREKLFNYYKSYQRRRWYDKSPSLRSAAFIMSLMENEEMENVLQIFRRTLKKEELTKDYEEAKARLLKRKNNKLLKK